MRQLHFIVSALFVSLVCFAKPDVPFDPYDPKALMPTGPHKGEPMDLRQKRSIIILGDSEAEKYKTQKEDTVFANFYHEGRFWIASVPKDSVEKVYFLKEKFVAPVPAFHTSLRLKLKPGHDVKLFPQTGEEVKPQFVSDLIFSVEGVPVRGETFAVGKAFESQLALSLRFYSAKELFFESDYFLNDKIEQIPLIASDVENQRILVNALKESHETGQSKMYSFCYNNCTNRIYELLDRSLDARGLSRLGGFFERLPYFPRTYLRFRGRISLGTLFRNKTPTFNEEFKQFKSDPAFPARLEEAKKQHAEDVEYRKNFLKQTVQNQCQKVLGYKVNKE